MKKLFAAIAIMNLLPALLCGMDENKGSIFRASGYSVHRDPNPRFVMRVFCDSGMKEGLKACKVRATLAAIASGLNRDVYAMDFDPFISVELDWSDAGNDKVDEWKSFLLEKGFKKVLCPEEVILTALNEVDDCELDHENLNEEEVKIEEE